MIDSNIMIDSNNIIYRKLSVTIHIVVLFNRLILLPQQRL